MPLLKIGSVFGGIGGICLEAVVNIYGGGFVR